MFLLKTALTCTVFCFVGVYTFNNFDEFTVHPGSMCSQEPFHRSLSCPLFSTVEKSEVKQQAFSAPNFLTWKHFGSIRGINWKAIYL